MKRVKRTKSATQRRNGQNFEKGLDNLFDIAGRDVLNTLPDDEKLFLISQRDSKRRGFSPASSSTSVVCTSSTPSFFPEYRDLDDENTNDSVNTEITNPMFNSSSDGLEGDTGEAHIEEQGIETNS